MRRLSALALPALLLATATVACTPPVVLTSGERRPRDDDDDEEEEEEAAEGEGEGDAGDVPPDLVAHPLGPHIEQLLIDKTRIDDDDVATLTVVVSDPDGVDDIIGPVLVDPANPSIVFATLSSPAPGTFTTTVRFATFDDVDFTGSDRRFVRVMFSDLAGHQVSQTQAIDLFCSGGLPACDGRCSSFRCDGACIDVGRAPTADEACAACNSGCAASAPAGAACFFDAPTCAPASDCLITLDDATETARTTCAVDEGVRLRDDGVAAWRIDGRDHAVDLEDADALGDALCADLGGVRDSVAVDVPAGFAEGAVLDVEQPCFDDLAGCRPVLTTARPASVLRYRCNVGPNGAGTFAHACYLGGCDDGTACVDGDCVEACGPCALCQATFGDCSCSDVGHPGDLYCESPQQENRGGVGERCRTDRGCDDGDTVYCNAGDDDRCTEICEASADCGRCEDAADGPCVCSVGTCYPRGHADTFFCLNTEAERTLTQVGTFSGVPFIDLGDSSCGRVGGIDDFWRFTAPVTATYTFAASGPGAPVVSVSDSCSGDELACRAGSAALRVEAGVDVVVGVDTGASRAAYTLTVSR